MHDAGFIFAAEVVKNKFPPSLKVSEVTGARAESAAIEIAGIMQIKIKIKTFFITFSLIKTVEVRVSHKNYLYDGIIDEKVDINCR